MSLAARAFSMLTVQGPTDNTHWSKGTWLFNQQLDHAQRALARQGDNSSSSVWRVHALQLLADRRFERARQVLKACLRIKCETEVVPTLRACARQVGSPVAPLATIGTSPAAKGRSA